MGASEGSIVGLTDPARKQLKVTYSVPESSPEAATNFQLRVTQGERTLLDDQATIRWSADECHPEPSSTKL
jgi:hypothetical protein